MEEYADCSVLFVVSSSIKSMISMMVPPPPVEPPPVEPPLDEPPLDDPPLLLPPEFELLLLLLLLFELELELVFSFPVPVSVDLPSSLLSVGSLDPEPSSSNEAYPTTGDL